MNAPNVGKVGPETVSATAERDHGTPGADRSGCAQHAQPMPFDQ